MGTDISNWADVSEAMYIGFGGPFPSIWLWVAIALCVIPLAIGFARDAKMNK